MLLLTLIVKLTAGCLVEHTRRTWLTAECVPTMQTFRAPRLPYGNVLPHSQQLGADGRCLSVNTFRPWSGDGGKYLLKESTRSILLTFQLDNLDDRCKLPQMATFVVAQAKCTRGSVLLLTHLRKRSTLIT